MGFVFGVDWLEVTVLEVFAHELGSLAVLSVALLGQLVPGHAIRQAVRGALAAIWWQGVHGLRTSLSRWELWILRSTSQWCCRVYLHLTQSNTTSAFSLVSEVADVFDFVVAGTVGSRLSLICTIGICHLLPFVAPWDVPAAPVDNVLVEHMVVCLIYECAVRSIHCSNMSESCSPSCGVSALQTAISRTCLAPSGCMAASRCLARVDASLLRLSSVAGVACGRGYVQTIQILAWVGGILSCLNIIRPAVWILNLIYVGVVAICVRWTSAFVGCLDGSAGSWASQQRSSAARVPLVPVGIH